MSMVPLGGVASSAAGAPLSQTAGSETERLQKGSLSQSRQTDAEQKAELAAGIGQTAEDQQTSERDADGRRLWEGPAKVGKATQTAEAEAAARQSKDATGQSGTKLDLTG